MDARRTCYFRTPFLFTRRVFVCEYLSRVLMGLVELLLLVCVDLFPFHLLLRERENEPKYVFSKPVNTN